MNYIVGDIGNTSTRICLLNHKFEIFNVKYDNFKVYYFGFILNKNFKFLSKSKPNFKKI